MLALLRETISSDGHRVGNQRHILLNSLIDSQGCGHILHHGTHIYRQPHRLDLPLHHGCDELFFTALRVFLLQNLNPDTCIVGGLGLESIEGCGHSLDGLRLIVLYAHHCRTASEYLLHKSGSDEDFLTSLNHYAVVGSEVRLALRSVEYEAVGLLARRRTEFHVSRESRSAKAHDSVGFDTVYYKRGVGRDVCHYVRGNVYTVGPYFFLCHSNFNMIHPIACQILTGSYGFHDSGCR